MSALAAALLWAVVSTLLAVWFCGKWREAAEDLEAAERDLDAVNRTLAGNEEPPSIPSAADVS